MQANTFAANPFLTEKSRLNGLWRMCVLSLVLVCLATGVTMAATNITNVNVVNQSDHVAITVSGNAPLKMSVLTSAHGNYLGFQFKGNLLANGHLVNIKSGRICNVRYSRFSQNPPLTRIVLNTTSHLNYSTRWSGDKSRVEISVWKFGAHPVKAISKSTARAPKAEAVASHSSQCIPVLPAIELGEAAGCNAAGPKDSAVVAEPARRVARIAHSVSSSKPASYGAGRVVSLNFLSADIEDVLKALAIQSGENIVVGSDVKGRVTVTLDNVTVEDALDYITRLTGYTYIKDNHTYLVGSTDNVGGLSNANVEIITLAYANADDVLEMLKAQCPRIRASKISISGGKARKHEQTVTQGKKTDVKTTQVSDDLGNKSQKTEIVPTNQSGNASNAPSGTQNSKEGNSSSGNGAKNSDESLTSTTSTDSPSSNMIALVGTEEKIAAAKAFIAQVEDAMKGQAAEKKIGVYEVKYVNTQELANTIMSLVLGVNVTLAPSAETSPVTAGQGQKIVPVSLLSGEKTDRAFDIDRNAFSHTLIIVGKAEDVKRSLDTAAQFDVPGETDLATYKVKYVDPNLLAKTIRKLVPAAYIEGLGITDEDESKSSSSATATSAAQTSANSQSDQGTESTIMDAAAVNNLSRTLVITGRKGDVTKARTLVEALDVKSPQVKIEAKITSLNESGEKELGLSWEWGELFVAEQSTNHWQRGMWDFGAKLDAIITNGDGKLLAAPSMVCLEGKPGQFFVGDQIRFITKISASSNGETTVETDTANVGVQLSVVGNVSDEGFITLNLHPEVSVVKLNSVNASGVAMTLPTITRRYTDHVVRVKDNSTIVIGGLINDEEVKTMSKIPLLGDLPVLGHLFKHTSKTRGHSEVVIFITASIVKD